MDEPGSFDSVRRAVRSVVQRSVVAARTGRRAGMAALPMAGADAAWGKSVVLALNSGAGEPRGLSVRFSHLRLPPVPTPTSYKGIEITPHRRRTMHTLCNNMAPTDPHVKRHIGLDPAPDRWLRRHRTGHRRDAPCH